MDDAGARASGVAGLFLTGGSSRRMGRDKADLHLPGGERLADRGARVLSAVARPVLEVGSGRSWLDAISEAPPGAGPLAAIAAGGRALREMRHHGPVLVLAADMPLVEAPLLFFLAAFPDPETVVPVADGRDQPLCARYSPAALEAADRLIAEGARAMRDLLAAIPVRRAGEEEWGVVAPPDAFMDLDTPEDIERLRGRGDLWNDGRA